MKYAILEAFPGFAEQRSLVRTSQGTLRGYLEKVNFQPPVFLAIQPEDPHGQAGDLLVGIQNKGDRQAMLKKCPRCGVQYTKEALHLFETTVKKGFKIHLTCGNCGAAMVIDENQVPQLGSTPKGWQGSSPVTEESRTESYDKKEKFKEKKNALTIFDLSVAFIMVVVLWSGLDDLIGFWLKLLIVVFILFLVTWLTHLLRRLATNRPDVGKRSTYLYWFLLFITLTLIWWKGAGFLSTTAMVFCTLFALMSSYTFAFIINRLLRSPNFKKESVLAKTAKHHTLEKLRTVAVEKLTNDFHLADVAKNAKDSQIRKLAIRKIRDQTIIANIAENDEHSKVRLEAVNKLEDQSVLAAIAQNDENFAVREAAVKHLEDQTIIANIAENDEHSKVRLEAVNKLEDQSVLAAIAQNDENFAVREAAVKHLEDQTIIANIAENDEHSKVRLEAVRKLEVTEELNYKIVFIGEISHGFNIEAVKKNISALLKLDGKQLEIMFSGRPVLIKKDTDYQTALKWEKAFKDNGAICKIRIIDKMANQLMLANIAKKDETYMNRWTAVRKLKDQTLLSDVAENAKYEDVQLEAINKLEVQTTLAGLAKNSKLDSIRWHAVGKLKDQTLLSDVAENAKYEDSRESAINKLEDQTTLIELAKNSKHDSIRWHAVGKLEDETILVKIALKDQDHSVRAAAIRRVEKQSILEDFAKNDENDSVRMAAIAKLTDQSILSNIAKNDEYGSVRQAALEKIDDQSVLANIAKDDEDFDVRMAAIEKLTDQSVLVDIAKNDDDFSIREIAVEMLFEQPLLAKIAISSVDYSVRDKAIGKITDQSLLENICKKASDYRIRLVALRRINSQIFLTDIAMNDVEFIIRETAVKMVKDKSFIEEIVRDSNDERITRIARNKLDTIQKGKVTEKSARVVLLANKLISETFAEQSNTLISIEQLLKNGANGENILSIIKDYISKNITYRAEHKPPSANTTDPTKLSLIAMDYFVKDLVDQAKRIQSKIESSLSLKYENEKCDICLSLVQKGKGYVLRTNEIVTEPKYWKVAFNGAGSSAAMMPKDAVRQRIEQQIKQQCFQSTGWLACERCITKFQSVDKNEARKFAEEYWKKESHGDYAPPNGGSVNPKKALSAAKEGWKLETGNNMPRLSI